MVLRLPFFLFLSSRFIVTGAIFVLVILLLEETQAHYTIANIITYIANYLSHPSLSRPAPLSLLLSRYTIEIERERASTERGQKPYKINPGIQL